MTYKKIIQDEIKLREEQLKNFKYESGNSFLEMTKNELVLPILKSILFEMEALE